MRKLNYGFLDCAKKMPPLHHILPGEMFDVRKSPVVNWLLRQPDIMQKLFNMAANNGVIRFNPETRTWQGVDYHGGD